MGTNARPILAHGRTECGAARLNLRQRQVASQPHVASTRSSRKPLDAPCASDTLAHDSIRLLFLRRILPAALSTPAPARRMANLLVMTPQQSFVAPQASPQHSHARPTPHGHGLPTAFSQSFNMPYDGSPHAHPPAHNQAQQIYSQSFPNGPVSNPGYARSFGEGYGSGRNYGGKPQIYTVCDMKTASAFGRAC